MSLEVESHNQLKANRELELQLLLAARVFAQLIPLHQTWDDRVHLVYALGTMLSDYTSMQWERQHLAAAEKQHLAAAEKQDAARVADPRNCADIGVAGRR